MKTLSLAGIVLLLLTTACNSSGDGKESDDTASGNITGVENVNGNMPDTSNSINLDASDTAARTQDTTPR